MGKKPLLALAVLALPGAAALAAAAPGGTPGAERPTFERDVRPILKTHCFQCHGEGDRKLGNLDVRLRRLIVAGGVSGPAVKPGSPAASRLLARVRRGEMPPGNKPHLSGAEVAVLERWIAAGAPTARPEPAAGGPGPQFTEEERAFWSFRPARRPPVPKVKAQDRVRTPIDAFLLARLEKQGLTFSPDADPATLIRRATFDLHGLPPTPAEVEAFVKECRAEAKGGEGERGRGSGPDRERERAREGERSGSSSSSSSSSTNPPSSVPNTQHPTPNTSSAYERLIDQLLASPRYGERWGRHWLDAAGYADSEGYNEADTVRDDAWPYRDYVIRALNEDRPFNRFIQEQLAGDEMVPPPHKNLSPEAVEKLTATGFLRMGPDGTGSKNDDAEAARNAVIGETVKIVSSSLLGMTVGCAECHDHRYDPILQKDYYRLRAIFEPALDWKKWRDPQSRRISLLTDAERAEAQRLNGEAAKVEQELKPQFEELRKWVFEKEVEQVPAAVREAGREAGLAWQKDPKGLTPEQTQMLAKYPGLKIAANQSILNLFLEKYGRGEELRKLVDENKARANAIRARKPKEQFIRALTEVPGHVPATVLFHRGDRSQPGEAVGPGDLSVLADPPVDFPADDPALPTTGRRLAFARRLTDGSHPLTARVLVNRFWMNHFGRGLVATPGDFGRQGTRPTHPELLDWLAASFVESAGPHPATRSAGTPSPKLGGGTGGGGQNPWSLKSFHRLVMLSTAYRQRSARGGAGERVDADNLLLWRMPVRRLEAEAVRDAVLAVSGTLNLEMFGPPVPVALDDAGQAVVGSGKAGGEASDFRRTVYVQARRSQPAYLVEAFDGPQPDPNCELRNNSTVPQQSLLMLNNSFILDQAERFAKRVRAEAGAEPEAQARHAWQMAFGSAPPEEELATMVTYLKDQSVPRGAEEVGKVVEREQAALASLCQALLASNRFLYVD